MPKHSVTVSDKLTMNVIRIVKGLGTTPDHSKSGVDGRSVGGICKLHPVTINGVTQQVSVDTRHTTFYVKLAHKPCLRDELLEE